MYTLCFLFLFVELLMVTYGALECYEGSEPSSNTSPFFTVQLKQGQRIAYPHIYYSKVVNEYLFNSSVYVPMFYDQTISWIEFGQNSNDEITIIVCLNSAQKGTFIYSGNDQPYLLPFQYNIDPNKNIASINESCISLYLDSTIGNKKHLSLEYHSTKTTSFHDAFYIFIGDLDPILNKSDPHTIYFGPGQHNIISNSSKKNNILQTGDNIRTIYISRGSWVYGKIQITGSDTNINTHIIGHGVLDGSYFNYSNRPDGVDGASMIGFQNRSKSVTLIGVTCHNSSNFIINLLPDGSMIDQYRAIGWYENNDGIGLGPNSSLSNSFIRTNDDSVKPWAGGPQEISNIVIVQMMNGAAFQLGWNNIGCVDCKISNSSIIHAYWADNGTQNAVIDLNYAWYSGQKENVKWQNVEFSNIFIDTPVGRMFSFNLENKVKGASTTVNNVTINNFISRTELKWFDPNLTVFQMIQIDDSNGGTNYVHNVHFNNVQVNGKHIVNDQGWNMLYFGDTNDIQQITYK